MVVKIKNSNKNQKKILALEDTKTKRVQRDQNKRAEPKGRVVVAFLWTSEKEKISCIVQT